jgi:DNA processing protein
MAEERAPTGDARIFWFALNRVKNIGAVRFRALLDHFGDAQRAWEAPAAQLRMAGLNDQMIADLLDMRAAVDLHALWQDLAEKGIEIVTWLDEAYPRRLKEIEQPPPVFYTRGTFTPADDWAVAVVGTRRFSPYGQQVAEELGRFLAHQRVTLVSGLAKGIDAIAHRAALQAGGRSIAVLGSGVDVIYPPDNRKLADDLIQTGVVLSDYSPGTNPLATNFPPRNRIISGLSLATVVVEAGQTSGALITAQFALEQGREVFAVPGRIYDKGSIGTNRLIHEGAHPLTRVEDLVEALDLTMVTERQQARVVLPADAAEASIYAVLNRDPLHIDEVTRQTGLPVEKVSATLALMELKGMVRQVGGMQYVSLHEPAADYDA